MPDGECGQENSTEEKNDPGDHRHESDKEEKSEHGGDRRDKEKQRSPESIRVLPHMPALDVRQAAFSQMRLEMHCSMYAR